MIGLVVYCTGEKLSAKPKVTITHFFKKVLSFLIPKEEFLRSILLKKGLSFFFGEGPAVVGTSARFKSLSPDFRHQVCSSESVS